jgi:hypothetical protein
MAGHARRRDRTVDRDGEWHPWAGPWATELPGEQGVDEMAIEADVAQGVQWAQRHTESTSPHDRQRLPGPAQEVRSRADAEQVAGVLMEDPDVAGDVAVDRGRKCRPGEVITSTPDRAA